MCDPADSAEGIDWHALPWSRIKVAEATREAKHAKASERWAAGAAHRAALAAWRAEVERVAGQYRLLVKVGAMSVTDGEIQSLVLAEVGPRPSRGRVKPA